jgi:hypothetical protein
MKRDGLPKLILCWYYRGIATDSCNISYAYFNLDSSLSWYVNSNGHTEYEFKPQALDLLNILNYYIKWTEFCHVLSNGGGEG